jgi:hypothetical protein
MQTTTSENQKRPPKTKPRSKPLPKAKEKYLEAEKRYSKN